MRVQNQTVNYYNEFDRKAAAWLRELIKSELIPAGVVDERSITEIYPHDLTGFTQYHFFAGIGGWPLALALAGWPEDEPIVTGSCPCQPFSIGSTDRAGMADPRHLWPVFSKLITQLDICCVVGEQVDDAIPLGWLDEVFSDLELAGYACGAAVLPARGYGADHWRDRLFWGSHASGAGRKRCEPDHGLSCRTVQALAVHGNVFDTARRALAGDWIDLPAFDGVSVGMVRSIVKGAGNAICPQVAASFIRAYIDTINE